MVSEPSEDVRAVLAAMESMDLPEMSELEPQALRDQMADAFDRGEPDVEMGAVEDREIPGPAGGIPVRIYTPASDGPHPVVVFYHGGGFVFGSAERHDAPTRVIARDTDAIVVSVDYRLAPEHPFPAPVEDAYAAVEWVAEQAAAIGGDPEHLAVAGDSAGGNLAAVVALAARDRDGPDIAHQALVYPVVDFRGDYPSHEENAEGYFLTLDAMEYFHEHYIPSWVHSPNPYLAPLDAPSHAGLPPASIATCGFDPLRDQGKAYVEALDAAGVPVAHHHYPEAIHGVMNMIREPMDVRAGHDLLNDITGDLRDALHE